MTRHGQASDDAVQFVIDDETMERLRFEAESRQMEVELLMVRLLAAASARVSELLDEDGGVATFERSRKSPRKT
ncbi:MAG: hypothetical protein QOF60_1022 [Actinomycetota bacterium]|jgi:hypothetical protein|nr:hypothetical protein [Actinomycetota bacterium]